MQDPMAPEAAGRACGRKRPRGEYQRGMATSGFRGLLPVMLVLFLFFSLGTMAVLYFRLQVPLSPHYGAAVTVVTRVRDALARDVVLINLVFFLATAAGVAVLGILYSHRVAGPLFKVRRHAVALGEGRFDEPIRFRRKDAVHGLAAALNQTSAACAERARRLDAHLRALEEALGMLDELQGRSADRSRIMEEVGLLNAEIRAVYQRLKL